MPLCMSFHVILKASFDQYYYLANFMNDAIEIVLGYTDSESQNRDFTPDVS